ncbi:MAG: ATP-binding cassette domain-containing protein [Planctomycetota bacterium]
MKIELRNVTKTYGRAANLKTAVDSVSWEAEGGEIFGLLGPNGAGKTTMIRMMLDIIRPDQGEILLDGHPEGNRTIEFKQRIGYLPEERGLYKKRKVLDVMIYFAALKGIDRSTAKKRAFEMLERFELTDWAYKKIEDLSKGMSQKIQIATCVLHNPDIVVLDEPFSGLDPVNVRLVRETIHDLKGKDKLVFLSTHMMSEVEALCDRIFMINQGRQVLYGSLEEIKKSFTEHEVVVDHDAEPEGLSCVASIKTSRIGKCVFLQPGKTPHDLMAEMAAEQRAFKRFEEASTPIEDIFVSVVQKDGPNGSGSLEAESETSKAESLESESAEASVEDSLVGGEQESK